MTAAPTASLHRASQSKSATAGQTSYSDPDASHGIGSDIGLGTGYRTGATSSGSFAQTMRIAKFKSVEFPAISVKNSSGRKLVKHVYPYRSGQELVDLGRTALTINISAIFCNDPLLTEVFGKDLYPGRYFALVAALNEGTSGLLVHPVFGDLTAHCESYSDTTQATEKDCVRLELTFVEDATGGNAPIRQQPLSRATASANALDVAAAK